jgi:hypothetical protein
VTGNIKTSRFFAGPVEGRYRTSTFVPFKDYKDAGVDCSETRTSFNHVRINGRWSGGGPWDLWRDVTYISTCYSRSLFGNNTVKHEGTVRLEQPTSSIPGVGTPNHLSDNQLNAMGTTAIARTLPTNPSFNLAQALGELRFGGVPRVPGYDMMTQTRKAKAAGGEYLNVEFGWLPLVRDLRSFAETVKQSDDILRKYQEGSDKLIPVSYSFPELTGVRADPASFSMTPAVGFFTGGGQHQSYVQRTWFEGKYKYHVPAGGRFDQDMRRYGSYARKLLGVDLTPEVVWNLSPWSWAADWFANTGDIMTNISQLGNDGLVLRHGYIMCHTRTVILRSGTYNSIPQTRVQIVERKTRRRATPFGFGVSFESLSPRRLAVLGAIGVSRANF